MSITRCASAYAGWCDRRGNEPQNLIFDPHHELLLQGDEEVPREGARVTRRINTVDGLMAPRIFGSGGGNGLAAVKARVGYASMLLNRSELDFRSSWAPLSVGTNM